MRLLFLALFSTLGNENSLMRLSVQLGLGLFCGEGFDPKVENNAKNDIRC